ncbi:peroxisomal biogenesis factor 3 [Fopius arisanus]|uniref:Peroxisomal biogenesis factor 3 n=1 Tax=Fopius arisanus TaxID=64838 RepID=A0A9R1U2I4_9HYME|nr:PREDICTED: peroxisomal biogenesis factor 3 [Fopius arisanus]XP_011304782.1 PREDICTED: peroxisomal biogenesis factor 3 [Fopius arisanus]XP_011304783.1 PREDICTED: peroxisomal biogenesis factor 3 [Fopius arisanus]
MFSSLGRFLRNHRRTLVVSGVIMGGAVVLWRCSRQKLLEWKQNEVQKLLQGSRRSQHFESTERSCNQTIMNLAVCVRNSVTKSLDTEKVVNDLREGSADKIAAWNKLKVFSIARSATIIYANTMLVATLRVQLSLMGAYMFKNYQKTLDSGSLSEQLQQKYLTLCSYFIDEGIQRLSGFIERHVEHTVSSIKLTDKLSIRDLEQIYLAIISTVILDEENDPVKKLTSYMLPSKVEREDDPLLKKIINETLDLLESQELQNLVQANVRTGFVALIDKISEYFIEIPFEKNGISSLKDLEKKNGFLDINKITMPMAKIIPIINGQVPDAPTQNDISADWLQKLIMNEMFKSFGANIYEAFSF